jgi:hypothetical protein
MSKEIKKKKKRKRHRLRKGQEKKEHEEPNWHSLRRSRKSK